MSELIAELHALIEQGREIGGEVRSAHDQARAALEQIRIATDGSSSPLPGEGIARLQSGLEKLEDAQSLLASGAESWGQYIDVLHGSSSRGEGGSAPSPRSAVHAGLPPATATLKGPAGSTTPTHVGKRHLFEQIRLNSPAKERNTVILPQVDATADVAAIKTGRALHVRDNLYEVNGRTYGLETPSGTVYPVRGDGFVEMDKLQFTAFKGLAAYNGDRSAAERDPKIARFRRHLTDQTWAYARNVFERGRGKA